MKTELFVLFLFNLISNIFCNKYYSVESTSQPYLHSHLSSVYTTKEGRQVQVFDDVFSRSHVLQTRMYYSIKDSWRFVLFDKFVTDQDARYDDGNGIPWKSWQDPTMLSSTRFGTVLQSLAGLVSANNTEKKVYKMVETYSAIIRRGDQTKLHKENITPNSGEVNGYSMMLFTNTLWRKNSYGQMLFYEDDGNSDIFAVITPKFGRVVVWDSSIPYIIGSPAISELSSMYLIFAKFLSNEIGIYSNRTHYRNLLDEIQEASVKPFVNTLSNPGDYTPVSQFDKHLVVHRESKAGETVSVYDSLFDAADLDALRLYTIKYGRYYFDDHLDLSSDNVQWIAGFNVNKFVKTKYWQIIKQTAAHFTGYDTWYPYDVACNLIRNYDHTRMHLDTSEKSEKEVTFLLYLSPNWTAEYYGETAFMEHNFDSPDNDYVAEVVPLYGRAVIFTGNFPHAAHPPSITYNGPRYTFAVKLQFSKMLAIKKTLHEESRHYLRESIEESISNIEDNPVKKETMQKISVVSSYLATQQVQHQLGHNDGIFSKMNHEFENDFEQDFHISEEEKLLLGGIIETESELELNEGNLESILNMAKYHNLTMGDTTETDGKKFVSALSPREIVDANRISNIWAKLCGSDANCFDDYLEYYMKRDQVVRHEKSFLLLTSI